MRVLALIFLCAVGISSIWCQDQENRSSKINPAFKWACRMPTAGEAAATLADPKQNPVGISGGCMPDALCKNDVSTWTNVFG